MCDCDSPEPDFYDDRIVKAHKPFRCCECCDTISAGRKCQVATGKWDDRIETFRTCIPCLIRWSRFKCRIFTTLCEEYCQMDKMTPHIQAWLEQRNARVRAIREAREKP